MRLADDPAFESLLRAALLDLKREQLELCAAAPLAQQQDAPHRGATCCRQWTPPPCLLFRMV